MNKYKAIPQVVDGIYFPSKYEASVYRSLVHAADNADAKYHREYKIHTQVTIVICQSTLLPPRGWKCDFAIEDLETGKAMLVEAKGAKQREFSYIINLLASNNPNAFLALTLVTDNKGISNAKVFGALNIKDSLTFHRSLIDKLQRGIHSDFSL